jgi:hypothetical protein
VSGIIVETSRPVSIARRIGALKCTTKWIAMFDDNVGINDEWFDCTSRRIGEEGVLAVSGMYDEQHKHLGATMKYTCTTCDPVTSETPSICNTLILKKVFSDYNPSFIQEAEDDALYNHLTVKGTPVRFYPGHAKHRYVDKYPAAGFRNGRNIRQYRILTNNSFARYTTIRLGRSGL